MMMMMMSGGTYYSTQCLTDAGVLLGIAWPTPGYVLGKSVNGYSPFSLFLVAIVFFASGLKLKVESASIDRDLIEISSLCWLF